MKQQLVESLAPIIEFLKTLDPGNPTSASELNAKFPLEGTAMKELATLFALGVQEKWLCDREGGPGVSYSRVCKASTPEKFSVDAVRMDCPGPGHAHPKGEFDLCFAAAGYPNFDGHSPGWVVYGPESWHIPTVSGGTMNILYFLPGGEIAFGDKS